MTPRPAHPHARPGFSLAEAVLSMAIVAIVSGATLSVTTLLARSASAEAQTGAADQTIAAREAVDQVASDLKMATTIVEKSATSITVTVPDRNADGVPETIRYAWAGSGSALTRQINGGAEVQVMPVAQAFGLTYTDHTLALPPAPTESSEQLLFVYDDASAGSKQSIKNSTWASEYFKPTLPANTTAWSITRVRIQGERNNSDIFYSVEIRALDASNKPTGSALASESFSSNSFGTSGTWLDLPFTTPAGGLTVGAGYAIVVRGTTSGTNAIDVYYDSSTVASTTRGWSTTTNSGSSWGTPTSTRTMQLYVYGTVTTTP